MKLSMVVLFLAMAMVSCATPGKSGRSFVVVQDIPAWAPGRVEHVRQVIVWDDGHVQDVRVSGKQVTSLAEFVAEANFRALPPLARLVALDEAYVASSQPGVVAEGRADKTVVVVSRSGYPSKFIHADNAWAPQDILALRESLPPDGKDASAAGSYITAKLLTPATAAYLQSGVVTVLSDATLHAFPELNQAIASPFKFVRISKLQWNNLKSRFDWKSNSVVIQGPSGQIMYLEHYG